MKSGRLLFFAVLAISACSARSYAAQQGTTSQPASRAADLNFLNGIMAGKLNDRRVYVLLGGGFFRPFTSGDPKAFVAKWLIANPDAVVIPISRMISTNTKTHEQQEITYIWIEDGARGLNVIWSVLESLNAA